MSRVEKEQSSRHVCWNSKLHTQLDGLRIEIDPAAPASSVSPIESSLKSYGFALLRGLGHEEGRDVIAARLIELAQSLGTIVPQSARGERIEDVKDYSDIDDRDVRGYRSSGEISPHSDPPTIILLHSLLAARRGGESHIVNVGSVYDRMQATDSSLTPVLFEAFPCMTLVNQNGEDRLQPSGRGRPIFTRLQGKVSCAVYRPFVEQAALALERPLTAEQVAALDLFEDCANHPSLILRFLLQPGETLLLHNRSVLHARTDYEDWPEMERRRTCCARG